MGALKHTPTRPARDMPDPSPHHRQGARQHIMRPRAPLERARLLPLRRADHSALTPLCAGRAWRHTPALDVEALTTAWVCDGALTAAWGLDEAGLLHRAWAPRGAQLRAAWWPLGRLDARAMGRAWTEALPCPDWPAGAVAAPGDPHALWQLAGHTPGPLHDAQALGARPVRALWHEARWWWICALSPG